MVRSRDHLELGAAAPCSNSSDPSSILSVPGLKRKTAPVTGSDGDEDLPTTPKPSPKKARRALPGSPEFDELPSVSFNSPSSPHLATVSQSLSFGSVEDTPFDLATPPSSPVPASVQKRIRKPSEKAKYMNSASTPANTPSKSKNSLIRVYPDGTEVKYTPPRLRGRAGLSPTKPPPSQAALPVVPEVIDVSGSEGENETNTLLTSKVRRAMPPIKTGKDYGKTGTSATSSESKPAKEYAYQDETLDGYESEVDDAHPSEVPQAQTYQKFDSLSQYQPVKEQAQSVDAHDELYVFVSWFRGHLFIDSARSDYERTKHKAKGKAKKSTNPFLDEEANDSDHEVTTSPQPVMRVELQDTLLQPYYCELPNLTFCEIIPYPSAVEASPNKDGTMLLFSPLAEMLTHRDEKARFFRAVQFVAHNSFLNPARIAPSQVVKQTSRYLTCASTRQTAIFISTGAIAVCNLITAVQAGSNQSPYTVKNVSIFPLTQEYERSISCIGMAFGVKEFYGPLVGGTLIFSTRTSNFPTSTSITAPATPKPKGLFSTFDSSSRRNAPYPANLGVDDTVPIYDGRPLSGGPGFEFRGADFDRIRSLPLYQGGSSDLPRTLW
ncbi:hypothetical protein BD779DRAFT_1680028 [Infundibulicybe gibba]|nr:hypothetical protein BD779DRAFT_1680028 [Infundibulicybe gibba]